MKEIMKGACSAVNTQDFINEIQFAYANNSRPDLDIKLAHFKGNVLIWNDGKGVVMPLAKLNNDLKDVLPCMHQKAVEYLNASLADAYGDKNFDPEHDVTLIGYRKEMSRTDTFATLHVWATDYRLTGDPNNPITHLEPVLDVFNQKYDPDQIFVDTDTEE